MSTLFTTFRTEVNDVVGLPDDVQIVFNDNHCIAVVNNVLERIEQISDVGFVKPHTGFVQNIKVVSPGGFVKFRCQLDALGFAPG